MTAIAAAARESERIRTRSAEASALLTDLMAVDPRIREQFMADFTDAELEHVLAAARRDLGTPFGLWRDDPVGFVKAVLLETTWSKEDEVLTAIAQYPIVAVPAGYEVGKTHIAARALVWRACVWPVGGSLTVTTATRMRQVQRQLWPHVRMIHARCGLPGEVDMAQWKMPDSHGTDTVVAYGFTAPSNDEAAAQGIHAPNLFLIVDEAGGVGHSLGKGLRGAMTGTSTKVLLIGNPPTDEENSWFEEQCLKDTGRPDSRTKTIPIPAVASPQITGERTGPCRSCPSGMPEHPLGDHLTDPEWVRDAITDFGEDAPFVQAKVYAKFPRGGAARIIPSSWVEMSLALVSLAAELGGEAAEWTHPPIVEMRAGAAEFGKPFAVQPPDGAWIRLGVDVAADGGDELAIARIEGDVARIVHTSSGATNQNSVDVAGKVLQQIEQAEAVRRAVGSPWAVRVKIDAIGVGWGVYGLLDAWRREGVHAADIVPVVVSERPERKPDKETLRPANKRAEMWLAGRSLLQPDADGVQGLRLDVDQRTAAQLSGPQYHTNSHGDTVIEAKQSMKKRGVPSPDRAEAVLLGVYEPKPMRRRSAVIV